MDILNIAIVKSITSTFSSLIEKWSYKNQTYKQLIYDNKKEIIKQDEVYLKYNLKTQKLKGVIVRHYPTSEIHKKWEFEGIIRNGMFFIIFYSDDLVDNPNSYGSIQLESCNNGYIGKYVKPTTKDKEKFKLLDIKWIKK